MARRDRDLDSAGATSTRIRRGVNETLPHDSHVYVAAATFAGDRRTMTAEDRLREATEVEIKLRLPMRARSDADRAAIAALATALDATIRRVTESPASRISRAVEAAESALFTALVENFPECPTGDLPPDATMALLDALRTTAERWVDLNRGRT